jgi:hypothetical protein
VLVGLLCSGCAGTQVVPNPTGYLQLSRGDAVSKKLLDENTARVPRGVWARQKIGTVCFEPEDLGEIILFIEESCARSQRCVREAGEQIEKSKRSMERIGLP